MSISEARVIKAVELEQILVDMGFKRVPDDPQARAEALHDLSIQRGRRVTSASKETWDMVQAFLIDRFPNTRDEPPRG